MDEMQDGNGGTSQATGPTKEQQSSAEFNGFPTQKEEPGSSSKHHDSESDDSLLRDSLQVDLQAESIPATQDYLDVLLWSPAGPATKCGALQEAGPSKAVDSSEEFNGFPTQNDQERVVPVILPIV